MGAFKQNYMDEHFPKRIVLAIIFCLLFIAVGKAVPDLYYRYLDKTSYYTVVQPIPVDRKWYRPCDSTVLTVATTSLLNLNVDGTVELILRKADQSIIRIPKSKLKGTTIVQRGNKIVEQVTLPLPCDLKDGLYYWQALVHYKVNGYDREYFAVSDTFNVNQWGVSPELMKIATESAQMTKDREAEGRPAVFRAALATPTPSVSVTQPQAGQSAQPQQSSVTVNNNQQPNSGPNQPTPAQNPSILDQVVDSLRKLL